MIKPHDLADHVLTDDEAATELPAEHEHPFPGNVLQTVETFYSDYSGINSQEESRWFTEDLDKAAVVTSIFGHSDTGIHRPVIDIDRTNEGTFNRETNHFACTECYIKLGQPSAPGGWKAP